LTKEKEKIGIQELGNDLNITKSGASKIIDRLEMKMHQNQLRRRG
jgi:DNA-binding MarR family transcriptional regulator